MFTCKEKTSLPLLTTLFFFILTINSYAVTDTFDSGTDGWSNSSNSSGKLRIDRDDIARKTYTSLGNANQTVSISLDINTIGDWEGSAPYQDWLKIWANGTQIVNDTYEGEVSHSYTSLSATLNSSGNLVLEIQPDTTGNSEEVEIDNINIYTTSCNGEIVSNIHNATNNATAFYNHSDTSTSTGTSNTARYFFFKTLKDGNITISMENNYNVSGYKNHRLRIGTSCNGTNIHNGAGTRIDSTTFEVNSNITYFVKVQESNSKNRLNFNLNFDFISNPNNTPTDILLSSNNVDENSPINTVVGTFLTTDADTLDTHSYTFANGSGDSDNDKFNINGSELRTSEVFDYELKNSYSIRVKTDDGNGGAYEKEFIININDLDDPLNFTCPNPKEFEISYTENIRGNVITIGNTNMCYNDGGVCGNPGNSRNNNINMMYSDPDGSSNTTTFNSSNANLQLSSTATIKWAKLYWQGYLVNKDDATKISAGEVLFQTPSTSSYMTIDSSFDDYDYNWIYFNSSRYYYQGSADVTSLVILGGNGNYTVANIVSELGKPTGGSYGGWALVIAYEDQSNETLKNLTVFDGYQGIVTSGDLTSSTDYANSNGCSSAGTEHSMDIPLSGFLTPYNGAVKSSLSIFAGEGDKTAEGDHIQLTDINGTKHYIANDLNPYNDIFNSTITYNGQNVTNTSSPISITPWYSTNSNGIDIDTFDISTDKDGNPLITNGQTSTTITLDTNGDGYMPSVFAFTTELYEPRVCYYIDTIKNEDNVTVFKDKGFIEEIDSNKEYTFDIWISNMKKDITDTDIETARLVQIYMNYTNFDYTEHSTYMQNLGEVSKSYLTDAMDSDKADFESDNNKSTWRIGIGANGSQGGTVSPADRFNDNDQKAFITYKGKFNIDSNSTLFDLLDFFEFKASFQTDSITIGEENAQVIEACVDLNTSGEVIPPPIGAFNVVNQNFSGGTMPDSLDASTALYTQVAGQTFKVKILSLNASQTTGARSLATFNDDVNVSIIITPTYSPGDDIGNQVLCDGATGTTGTTISFNNTNMVTATFSHDNAVQGASFKITFFDGTEIKHVCSLDSFSIKPARYESSFSPNDTTLRGGRLYSLNTISRTNTGNKATNYNHTSGDANLTTTFDIPTGCIVTADINTSVRLNTDINQTFITFNGNGDSNVSLRTGNIGDYNITIKDTDWTNIDQDHAYGDDCIKDSNRTTHDSNGKVGCNIETMQTFAFSPKDFENELTLQNFDGNNFTYISNDGNMSAQFTLTTRVRLDNNATATSYTANCYSKDITFDFDLTQNPLDWNLTQNAEERIRFYDDRNITSRMLAENFNEGNATFITTDGNFTNGVADINLSFTFERNASFATNPFRINASTDFNITHITDEVNVTGNDFNRSFDKNASFYYARVYATDVIDTNSPTAANIRYEVYCDDCNTTRYTIVGSQNPDSSKWLLNTQHNITDGNVSIYDPIGKTGIHHINAAGENTTSTSNTLTLIAGEESQQLTNNSGSNYYQDRVQMFPSTWLIYNQYNENATYNDFTVTFQADGNWSGQGQLGQTVDVNLSTRTNRRLEW